MDTPAFDPATVFPTRIRALAQRVLSGVGAWEKMRSGSEAEEIQASGLLLRLEESDDEVSFVLAARMLGVSPPEVRAWADGGRLERGRTGVKLASLAREMDVRQFEEEESPLMQYLGWAGLAEERRSPVGRAGLETTRRMSDE